MEKVLYSTSELLFSNRSFWVLQDNEWKEFDSIRFLIANLNLRSNGAQSLYEETNNLNILKKFIQSNFWKFFNKRIWQKDDFKFNGVAAAIFMKQSNRFNVKFNPFKFYVLYIEGVLAETIGKENTKEFSEKLTKYLENDEKFEIEVPGINFQILKLLYTCSQNGTWDEKSWKQWNNFLINDFNVLRDCISVFIHEYLHIILNHITGREEDRNKLIWNYATDYAINQSCVFTEKTKKLLITDVNKEFFSKFKISAVVYQYKTDTNFKKVIDENFHINQYELFTSFSNNLDKIKKMFHFDSIFILSHLNGKSADEYYNILLENPDFQKEEKKVKGYDSHDSWDIEDFEDEPEDGVPEDLEGEAGDGDNNGDDDSDGEQEKETNRSADSRVRGKKVTTDQTHAGFDIDNISQKTEVRSAIKEILNNLGIDANDPAELEKGISSIPGLSSHSSFITNIFKVKTKNWKQMLQNFLTFSANVLEKDYTMSRESRIRADYYPGKKLEQGFECIFIMDTSGSIQAVDWNDFCNQIKKISKDFNVDKLRIIQCHTRVCFDEYVKINHINKMPLKETGGTMMQVAFERLKKENNRHPVILFTDGDIDHFKAKDYPFKSVIFLSRGHSYNQRTLEAAGFRVICQDEE